MTTNRREFMQLVIGGIAFGLAAKNVEAKPVENTTGLLVEPQALTEEPKALLPEGYYTVKIVDIDIKDSRIRPEPNFWFKFEEVQSKRELVQVISSSPLALHELMKMVDKVPEVRHQDTVDLTGMIGKEIGVVINHHKYMNRAHMSVRQ